MWIVKHTQINTHFLDRSCSYDVCRRWLFAGIKLKMAKLQPEHFERSRIKGCYQAIEHKQEGMACSFHAMLKNNLVRNTGALFLQGKKLRCTATVVDECIPSFSDYSM